MSSVLDYGRVKKMKEKLLKNWGLKIMAVLIAFLVWFLVANIEDYTITKTITGIPVELLNEDAITGQDMVYEIEQGKTVDVKVDGRRSGGREADTGGLCSHGGSVRAVDYKFGSDRSRCSGCKCTKRNRYIGSG